MKLFLSYTLRGNDVTVDELKQIKNQFQKFTNFNVYVDRLNNKIPFQLTNIIELNNENLQNKYQKTVKDNLLKSDVVCLLESDEIYNSEWVKEECKLCELSNKKYIVISKQDWKQFLEINNHDDLMNLNFIKQFKEIFPYSL